MFRVMLARCGSTNRDQPFVAAAEKAVHSRKSGTSPIQQAVAWSLLGSQQRVRPRSWRLPAPASRLWTHSVCVDQPGWTPRARWARCAWWHGTSARLEIEAALERNVRVIPILVQEARMPHADELPGSLAKLARRQAIKLSPHRFKVDIEPLLRVLDRAMIRKLAPPANSELWALIHRRTKHWP